MPDAKFSQKPNHMVGRNRRISSIGTPEATPRIRSAIAALMPAASPIPTVCADRIPGNAKNDGEPRTHSLAAVDSSQARKFIGSASQQLSDYQVTQLSNGQIRRLGQCEDEDS